jgi:CBS domain-containing membrane protein
MTVSRLAGIDENIQDDLDRHIPISKVMKKKIITADPEMDASKAIEVILKNHVGCLPVVSRKKLVGIVTEADFLAFTYTLLKKRQKV